MAVLAYGDIWRACLGIEDDFRIGTAPNKTKISMASVRTSRTTYSAQDTFSVIYYDATISGVVRFVLTIAYVQQPSERYPKIRGNFPEGALCAFGAVFAVGLVLLRQKPQGTRGKPLAMRRPRFYRHALMRFKLTCANRLCPPFDFNEAESAGRHRTGRFMHVAQMRNVHIAFQKGIEQIHAFSSTKDSPIDGNRHLGHIANGTTVHGMPVHGVAAHDDHRS